MTPLYLVAEREVPYDPTWKMYSDEYLRWHLHSGFVAGGVGEAQLKEVTK